MTMSGTRLCPEVNMASLCGLELLFHHMCGMCGWFACRDIVCVALAQHIHTRSEHRQRAIARCLGQVGVRHVPRIECVDSSLAEHLEAPAGTREHDGRILVDADAEEPR